MSVVKIINLNLGQHNNITIQFLIVVKNENIKNYKEYFLLLARDSTEEITICLKMEHFNNIKVNHVYQLTGFTVKMSDKPKLTNKIIFASYNYKLTEIQSHKIHQEYINLPIELFNTNFITSGHAIETLIKHNDIVNVKCKLLNIARIRQEYFLLDIQIDDMMYKFKISHIKDLSHLKDKTNIIIKRMVAIKNDSILFCSTIFTQIFADESDESINDNEDLYNNYIEQSISDILNERNLNKLYKKTCRVLYFRFVSFYQHCPKCKQKISNYNNIVIDNNYNKEQYCNACDFPIDTDIYAMNVELTVVELSDKNAQTPFTILLYDEMSKILLKNTSNNIHKYLKLYSVDEIINYFKNKIIGCEYEIILKTPYVKPPYDIIYKRFTCEKIKLIKMYSFDKNMNIDIIDDFEDMPIKHENKVLSLNDDNRIKIASTIKMKNNIEKVPILPLELIDMISDDDDDDDDDNNEDTTTNLTNLTNTPIDNSEVNTLTAVHHSLENIDDNGSPYEPPNYSDSENYDESENEQQKNKKRSRPLDSDDEGDNSSSNSDDIALKTKRMK